MHVESPHPLRRLIAVLIAVLVAVPVLALTAPSSPVSASQTPGQGFTVSAADISYILDQIKIAEQHTALKRCFEREAEEAEWICSPAERAAINPALTDVTWDRANDPQLCAALRAIIVNPMLSFGLRTTDGSCNNLQPGQDKYGAADQTFPRLTTPEYHTAGPVPTGFPGAGTSTSYANHAPGSFVFDGEPRLISNIIVDQTKANPAAVCASQFPARAQGGTACSPLSSAELAALPEGSLPIDNITTDVGLSPPFNSLFTIFGQFFDHGLDKITNGGNGTVFVPLADDDPLVAGDDHTFGTADDIPPNQRFMVLTRGSLVTDGQGNPNSPNTDTPFVDQSQTYTSHQSHQVFLREYFLNASRRPVSTGTFLSSTEGGEPRWSDIKDQAATKLGLLLVDQDVNNIPLLFTDPYGNFIPGRLRGLPQYVTASGLVEGDIDAPVAIPADAFMTNTAFLNDIAHSADPGSKAAPKTPDANDTAGNSLDPIGSGLYDDELLDLHFICGDGRCNENIGLTAIHQVFHSEHNRLVEDVKQTIIDNSGPGGMLHIADWTKAGGASDGTREWNGERLFQVARFVTEMEYQHLVFEEFARKVQPLINPFQPFAFNQTDLNPAITAEFAHAVYRFGHSMLDDTIPRVVEDPSTGAKAFTEIQLFDAFLNPGEYYKNPTTGQPDEMLGGRDLTADEAAGAIIMGLSDQTGQEIDEFVVDTLRNHLVGLPLDLPALNMTRARSEGIPPLNEVRRQIFAATNDGQMAPYTDWFDFGQNLKHPESLVNFIAAYGTHPRILNLDPDGAGPVAAGSIAARRAAADQLVNGTVLPNAVPADASGEDYTVPAADSAEFMFGSTPATGTDWSVTETGVNRIDLWVGGLAERTNLFGGLLGSTFNYVFEKQLTDLQNGDRFYYLARTPGMNLRAQLEGNSFAELIMRNTTAHSLKADPFANADCKFELGSLVSPAPSGSTYFNGLGSIGEVAGGCEENGVLVRMADGTIRYRTSNPVNVPGINFQAVYNGTDNPDRIYGGVDNDTFWGREGNDTIEGGDGADIALGGNGDDVITDLAGDDVPKGGPGNDAIDGGPGLDIIMGGDGNDFTTGGANINETFGGAGDDFAIAGQGEDEVLGDSGDDWMEGGDQPDLLIGDSSTLFFDDHNLPGNDIHIGQGGDDDYDGEGGDDVFVAGPGVEKNAGASGYDWSIGVNDPQPQNADLRLRIVIGTPPVVETRDKFNEVEGLSGWKFDDTLVGDDIVPSAVGGGGFIGCDALDADGILRIAGLGDIITPDMLTEDGAAIAAASATRFCQLEGNVWGKGNILLGGGGNDTLEGRGADDVLDGDRYMNVRLSVRTDPADPSTEIGTTDLMEHKVLSGTFGAGTDGMTLIQAVFARKVQIGQIVAVREILPVSTSATDVDTAMFGFPFNEYTLIWNANGSLTVSHQDGLGADGTDILWNIEQLSFCDTPGAVPNTCDTPRTIIPAIPPEPAGVATLDGLLSLTSFAALPGQTDPNAAVLTVTNTGNAPLEFIGTAFLAGPDPTAFAITDDTCVLPLDPTLSCTVTIRFTAPAAGLFFASINLDTTVGAVFAGLSGTGLAPIATATPTALTGFIAQVGQVSATQVVTVTNTGDTDLTFGSPADFAGADPGDFAVTEDLCTVLAPGQSCTITVALAPLSNGAKTALLQLHHDGLGDQVVSLDGVGTQGIANVTPGNLAFGNQLVGTQSATQAVTLLNAGDGALTISSVSLGGTNAADFAIVNDGCTGVEAPAGSCSVTVRFAPTTAGGKSAHLTIANDGAGGDATVALSGTGTAPVITTTTPTAFTGTVGVLSASKTITVGNAGTGLLVVGAVTLAGANPGDFRITSNNCTNVNPGATCAIGVAFRPTTGGTRNAVVRITNSAGAPRDVPVTGAATPARIGVAAGLAFPNTRVGRTSTRALAVSNTGGSPLTLGTISVIGRFTATRGNCPATLAPGRSCNLSVTFRPNTFGLTFGLLTINSNSSTGPATVLLAGTGV